MVPIAAALALALVDFPGLTARPGIVRYDPRLLEDPPDDLALTAIFEHELAHVEDYKNRGARAARGLEVLSPLALQEAARSRGGKTPPLHDACGARRAGRLKDSGP